MKKLFTTAVLTVAAVPYLMAAPNATKKAQNQTDTATQTQAAKKSHKKHAKKGTTPAATNTASPAVASPKN